MRRTPRLMASVKHPLGKAGHAFLRRTVYGRLGRRRPEVLVGPGFGVDTSIVTLGNDKVLVTTTDPLSLIPSVGAVESAWLSAHLIASDIATSGLMPEYGIFDFNLPPSMQDSLFAAYWRSFHRACKELGLAIIGGHTGRYDGCDYTIIGGGVMIAVGTESRVLTAQMGEEGDDLILTKGAAIETTAVLTRVYPRRIRRALGGRLFEKAWRYLHQVSVVKDAITAVSVGIHEAGVTAMHDATEGGVTTAALELATASNLGLRLDLDQIAVSEETRQICKLFRIDPLISLSEGSLVVSCKPSATGKVISKLASKGLDAQIIGRLTSRTKGYRSVEKSKMSPLNCPRMDPYWKAFHKAEREGWS